MPPVAPARSDHHPLPTWRRLLRTAGSVVARGVPMRGGSMRGVVTAGVFVGGALLAGCSGRSAPGNTDSTGAPGTTSPPTLATCCSDSAMGVALRIANDYRESAFSTDRPDRATFWDQVLPMATYARMASSVAGALDGTDTLRTLQWGNGSDTVLLWSEGGDTPPGRDMPERSVGSLTVADLVRWLANTRAEDRDDALRARLRSGVTLVLLPMLRSTAADTTQQRIVRDVIRRWHPSVVLALRDGGSPSTAVGLDDPPLAAITLRVLPAATTTTTNADAALSEATRRGTRVAVALLTALRSELPGRLFRASPSPVARTLVDAVADAAVSEDVAMVELESGALPADPAQRRLRAVQVAALLTALDGIATGAVRSAETAAFTRLPVLPPQAGSSPE